VQPKALARILERTAELGFGMASEERTGALLRTLAASKPNGRFVELGTGTGIATAWLLDGMDSASRLVSVDVDERFRQVAREALSQDARLTLIAGDAISFLQRQEAGSFDFVFADAMAGKYEGLNEALRVVKKGGFYVVDDMLPQANWPDGHGVSVQGFMVSLAARPDFVIAQMDWASGIVVAVRR
jgi:predicted O-methyltransferase YrrM